MSEQQSGEVDQCVGTIYCDGHDWLTDSIALWVEEVKILEDGIRKLKLTFVTWSQPYKLSRPNLAIEGASEQSMKALSFSPFREGDWTARILL